MTLGVAMSTHELVSWILGTVLSATAVVGLLVKYALMPYVRENIAKPLEETHRQVTVNGHSSDRPTVLDSMSDLRKELLNLRGEMSDGFKRQDERMDEHIQWHLGKR